MEVKKNNHNDIIYSLIEKNKIMEEFSEEETEYYNECIEKLENDVYSDTYKIKLEDLDEELEELKSKVII